jgi:hypothetical protein
LSKSNKGNGLVQGIERSKFTIRVLAIMSVAFITACIFSEQSSFEKSIVFNGEVYEHHEQRDGSWVINHYYIRAHENLLTAKKLIHILEIDEGLVRTYWNKSLFSTIGRYGLETIGPNEYEMVGSFKRLGMEMLSLGTPIVMNGQDNLVFYISQQRGSDTENRNLLKELSQLTLH